MGFTSFDALARALTVNGDGGDVEWSKTTAQTSALTASSYHDLLLGGDEPAAVTLPTGSRAFVAVSGGNGTPTHNGLILANPDANKTRHALVLEGLVATANGQGDLYLLDVLGFYPDFDLATGGTLTTGDTSENRTARYSKGVFAYLVTQTALAGTLPTVVATATKQDGSSVVTPSLSLIASSAVGRVPTTNFFRLPFPGTSNLLNLRQLAFTGGAGPSGKVAVILARKLASLKLGTAQVSEARGLADPRGSVLLPRIVDNAFLSLVYRPASTPTAPRISATLYYADGQNPS